CSVVGALAFLGFFRAGPRFAPALTSQLRCSVAGALAWNLAYGSKLPMPNFMLALPARKKRTSD
ncbi:MAG: hypothetical protein J1E35_10305, partial [Lachnospiraceae bacterium]|nr:hypothetical protein [Lachnospiraceae bacterium]